MPNTFANGKRAIAECDRCGFRFRLNQLRTLVINTKNINFKVCDSCWEPDHPQLQLGMYPVSDPQALRDPRTDRGEFAQERAALTPVYSYLSGSERTFGISQVGTVTVTTTSAPSLFVLDTFSGSSTTLGLHVGEIGASWQEGDYFSTQALGRLETSGAGVLRVSGDWFGPSTYDVVASGTPPSADYYAEAEFTYNGDDVVYEVSVFLRTIPGVAFYRACIDAGTDSLFLEDQDGTIVSTALGPLSAGTHTLRYAISGSAHTVTVDGVVQLTATDGTNTTAGQAGLALLDLGQGTGPYVYTVTISRFEAGV